MQAFVDGIKLLIKNQLIKLTDKNNKKKMENQFQDILGISLK
jgi:hypothetical protein